MKIRDDNYQGCMIRKLVKILSEHAHKTWFTGVDLENEGMGKRK